MAQGSNLPPIGLLRDRVTLQSRTLSASALGDQTATWATEATVWANVQEVSGSEPQQSAQVQADTSCVVELRYHSGLDPSWRLLFGGNAYQITGVTNPDGRKRFHRLTCQRAS